MAENKMPSMEPVQSPQSAPEQPQVVAQVPQGGSSNNRTMLFVVGAVVLLVAGVAGYGYWNGSQIKSYAEKTEQTLVKSEKWADTLQLDEFKDMAANSSTDDMIADAKKEISEKKKEYEEIKVIVEKDLTDLTKASAPGKAKELKTNVTEYLNLYKNVSSEAIYYMEIGDVTLDAMSKMMKMDMYSADEAAMLDELVTIYEAWVVDLKKVEAPSDFKDAHDSMVKALEDMIDSLKDGDVEALSNMDNPLDEDKIIDTIKDQADKIEELSDKIDEQVKSLKNTTFSF